MYSTLLFKFICYVMDILNKVYPLTTSHNISKKVLYEIITLSVNYFRSYYPYDCVVRLLIEKRASHWMLFFMDGIIQSVPSAGFGFYVPSLRTV
ncbi:hypothetical protein EXW59_06825 [Bacillus mycoides]|nr:hypothetical protein EXW59_06825 [Bacillus mycoides]